MDSDEEVDFQNFRGVPGTIILINVYENSKSNIFETAHVATCRLFKEYMRLSTTHNVAVCLFGTEDSCVSKFDLKPVVELVPLSVPTLNDYRKLKNANLSSFTEAKELKLSESLWHCSKMFSNCTKQLSSRTLVICTRLDIPPVATDHNPTLNKARDLVDSNIAIKIINISKQDYKIDAYYEKFLKIASKGLDYIVPKPLWDPIEIEKIMQLESHRHLAVAKLNFEIGKDFNIGVGVYTLLRRSGQNYNKNVNLDSETNTILNSVTKTMKVTTEDTGHDSQSKQVPVLKSEIIFYQQFGGENIEFTDNEMKAIKNPFGGPMIKLLGFKPTKIICKEKWYVKMGYFLFPDEKNIEGSTVAFRALHKACEEMEMVAFCILCTRVNARPNIVALSPCTQPLNLDIDVGFDIIYIPYVENIRDININEDEENEESINIEEAHKALMSSIMNKLIIEYSPNMFEDPKLQSKYRAVEAKALEDEDCEPFIDTTKQNPEKFENIGDDVFEELFGPFNALGLKRTAQKTTYERDKKQKVEDLDEELLKDRLKNKQIHIYTVQQLQKIIRFKNIDNLPALTGLKKKELVELVYKHVS